MASLDIRGSMPAALASLDAAAPGTHAPWLHARLSGSLEARFSTTFDTGGALRLDASLAEADAPPAASAHVALSFDADAGAGLLRAHIPELSGNLAAPFGEVEMRLAGSAEATPPSPDWLHTPLDLTLHAAYRPSSTARLATAIAERQRNLPAPSHSKPATYGFPRLPSPR